MMKLVLKGGRVIEGITQVSFFLYNGEMPDELVYTKEGHRWCVDISAVEKIVPDTGEAK